MKRKLLTVTADYSSPRVETVNMDGANSPLCGSFTGSGTQDYEDEDIWAGVN